MLLTLIGIITLIRARGPSRVSVADTQTASLAIASPVASASAAAPAAFDSAPPQQSTSALPTKSVILASDPFDAHLFRDGQDLGAPPLTVDVPGGKQIAIEARREGFVPRTVVLDGSEAKLRIKLVKVVGTRPTNSARPAPRFTVGGDAYVNPWAK